MAIKAHLDHQSRADEGGRTAPRRALRLETTGFVMGAGEANVTIHNISSAGLLLESGLDLAVGEQLALDLPEAGAVIATVVWRSDRLYGCAFAEAIGPAALAAAQLQGFAPGVPTRPLNPAPVAPPAGLRGRRCARHAAQPAAARGGADARRCRRHARGQQAHRLGLGEGQGPPPARTARRDRRRAGGRSGRTVARARPARGRRGDRGMPPSHRRGLRHCPGGGPDHDRNVIHCGFRA